MTTSYHKKGQKLKPGEYIKPSAIEDFLNTGVLRKTYINSILEEIKIPPNQVRSVDGRSWAKLTITSQEERIAIFAIKHGIRNDFAPRNRTKIESTRVINAIKERDKLRN